jgi:signal transduction histidine kinase/DNA-binding response OmpR family regulator/PAS domain-containing protein
MFFTSMRALWRFLRPMSMRDSGYAYLPDSDRYDENLKAIMTALADEYSLSSALEFLDVNTIAERMQGKTHIVSSFNGRVAGACRLHLIKENGATDGELTHVILAVEVLENEEYQSVLNVLTENYWNVYLLNPEDDTAKVLKYTDGLDKANLNSGQVISYTQTLHEWVRNKVYSEDQGRLLKVLDIDYVCKELEKQKKYEGNYRRSINGGIQNFQFIYTKMRNSDHILVAYQNIDSIIEEHRAMEEEKRKLEEAHQKEKEEQIAIINALSQSFRNVFVANLSDGTARVIRLADSYNVSAIRDVNGQTFPFDAVVDRWVRETVHPEDKKRVKEALNMKNLRKIFSEQDKCTGTYRNIEDGVQHYYQYDFRRVGDTDNIVAGFQIIDDVVEEQNAHQKELEEHAEVVNSLATIYSTIFRADIDTHEYEILASVPLMGKVAPTTGNFDDVKKTIIENFMEPEFRKPLSEFLDLNTLADRLENVNTVTTDYKAPTGQWMQARFIAKRRDENGRAVEILYVARDITEEKIRDLKQQEDLAQALEVTRRDKEELQKSEMMLREAGAISDALSRDYSNVFLVQPKKNLGKTVKEENYNVKGIEAYSGEWFDYTFYIRKYIEVRVYEPDVEMMLEKTELSRVLKEIETNTDFSISYRALVDGKVHYLQMRYVSVDGTDLVAIGFRYVDDVVKAEAEQKELLQEALAAAQQANKAKTTFLNSMSHDIRTPMNAIIGFTALAQTHLEDHDQVEDYLSKISISSNHLLSLINDILDMSRIESGTVKLDEKAVHIPDLLHDLRTMIQSLVNSKNLNLFIDTQDVVHEDVLTDKLRLNQVLLNIVGNAIKFTQPGGDIIIRLIEKPCSLKHYTTYEFSVKDNGIGMSKEFVGHIFDTFSREYSSTVSGIQGTGLGMAITKNIVDMMGGDIQVESEEGRGSLFTVTLNLRLANEPVKNEPIPELLGARALVVDDDMNTCRSVSKMLRDIEMRPDWTTSAKEAIVHAQDASEAKDEYKVYIIDYLMPDMNGIETVRRIRKVISEDVPIIVLTAYDWGDFEHEAREAGVTAFVSKPIFMSELREVLTQPVVSEKIAKEEKQKGYDYSDKHVLLVEDNELNREIAMAILEETGMTIDYAEDGDIAVATINREPADKYDLILMDVQMPRMDGYTATREIRTLADNKKANLPIVAMTANAFEEDKKKAYESGMNGHIIKPISIEEIVKVLDGIFTEKK